MARPAWKLALFSALTTLTADASMAARPEPVKDFSRQVEVVVGGRLRETAKGQGELAISLWNKTTVPVAGPIFVVVDETGLKEVQIGNHDSETPKGKPVFEVVPEGKTLHPGGMTGVFPIAFSMPEGMPREEANKLQLATRVFARNGLIDEQRRRREQEAKEDADFATSGKSYTQADLDRALATQKQVTPEIMKKPDMLGTAITEDSNGNLALRVYTDTRAAAKSLPGSYGDLKVDVKPVPGGFSTGPATTTVTKEPSQSFSTKAKRDQAAAAAKGTGKDASKGATNKTLVTDVDQTAAFARPVPIGVSTSNGDDPLCAAGTLGFRAKDLSGKLYAISNSHVWAESGLSATGARAVQPGALDNNCLPDTANNTIGTLVDFTTDQNSNTLSPFFKNGVTMNFVDSALIEIVNVTDGAGNTVPAVSASTPSDGYGAPSTKVLNQNRVGLQVQKYGRTSGYTRGYTSATNVMAPILGEVTPRDDTNWYRLDEYTGTLQNGQAFGGPGDSGSLIVTFPDRRPVSLLIGGGAQNPGTLATLTVANRISFVLSRFNVTVDDGGDPKVSVGGAGNEGMLGRGGLATGNLSRDDLANFLTSTTTTLTPVGGGTPTTVTVITSALLPPELAGRVKANRPRLIPITDGSAFP